MAAPLTPGTVGRAEPLRSTERRVVHTEQAPRAAGPYSQAIIMGDFVFLAGQVGLDPATGKLVEGGVEAQVRQILANLGAVLQAAGTSFDRVVKTTIFLTDVNDFATVNRVYGEVFKDQPPARSTIGVAALPLGALAEIEAIAAVG